MKSISEKTTIAKNASSLVAADVITIILEAILTIFIARKLGASNFGLLVFAMSFTRVSSFFIRFGFRNLISRDIAKEPGKTSDYLGHIFFIQLIFSVIVFIVILSILHLTNSRQEKIFIVMIALFIMIMDAFIEFFNAFFRGHQKTEYEALIKIILHVLTVSTGITILLLGYGLIPLLGVRLAVYLFTFFLGYSLVTKKFSRPNFHVHLDLCIQIIKSAIPFATLGILVTMNAQLGTIFLSFIHGDEVTGWYSAALRLCNVFGFIPAAFIGAVLPAMSKFSQNHLQNRLIKTYEGTLKFLLIIVLPIAVGTTLLADNLILLIYGEGYQQSILVLRILIWFLVFSFLNHGYMSAFASVNNEKKFVKIQVLGTIMNVCLNIILIPSLGIIGVSIALVASQIIIFIVSTYILTRQFHKVKIGNTYFKPVLAVLMMGIFLFILKEVNFILLIFISLGLYSVFLFLLKTFSPEEISILRDLYKKGAAKLAFLNH